MNNRVASVASKDTLALISVILGNMIPRTVPPTLLVMPLITSLLLRAT